MNFNLRPLHADELERFKKDMQESFQQGAVDGFGSWDKEVLPESHIDRALAASGSIAYAAIVDGEMLGGAIVCIERDVGELEFLYVKCGVQNKGVGQAIWQVIEQLHPEVTVWKTCTPYFEKRNIHFYVNRCGFHIVQFYTDHFPDPHKEEGDDDEYFDGMFQFEKILSKK